MSVYLDKEDLMNLVLGAGFLGTGGGGSIETGKDIVRDKLEGVKMVSVDELDNDADVVVASGMGAPEALFERGWGDVTVSAFEALEDYVGKEFDYVLTPELGASTTLGTMTVTSELGVPVVDGDGAGRAVPELQMSMFSLNDVPPCPASVADDKGNSVIINAENSSMLEEISRAVTQELGNHAGFVAYMMSGKTVKDIVINGTISFSLRIGELIDETKRSKEKTVDKLINEINGFELIKGVVIQKKSKTDQGFDIGQIKIQGIKNYQNEELTVKFKNENMLAIKNGKVLAMSPDRICWLKNDGQPLTNVDIKEGHKVACVGIKSPKEWRTQKGLRTFKKILKSLGYQGEYRPIESTQRNVE